MTDIMHAAISGNPSLASRGRLIAVDDPIYGVVLIRWRIAAHRWKCAQDGLMTHADCPHAYAAALLLADVLLGLTPTTTTTEKENPNV